MSISPLRRTAVARMTATIRSGFRVRAAGILVVLGMVALGAAQTASADMNIAGVWFESDAYCYTAPRLEVGTKSNARQASAMTYLSEYRNGAWTAWIHGPWRDVSSNSLSAWTNYEDFHFPRYEHHYYRVMMHYAVSTATGWQYGGEYINPYHEQNEITHWFLPVMELSTNCYI